MVLASEAMANGICQVGDVKGFPLCGGLKGLPLCGGFENNLGWKNKPGVIEFQKEKTMKNAFVWTILGIVGGTKRTSFLRLAALLCALVFSLGGCALFEQGGETANKGHRRHLRNLTINQQSLISDIDRALLIDKPSALTDKRIPPEISD